MRSLLHLKDTLTLGERRMRVLPLWLVLGSVPVYILAETRGCTGKYGDGIWRGGAFSKYHKVLLSNCLANN